MRSGRAHAGRSGAGEPALEWQVRTRVQALPNVEIIGEYQAAGLVGSGARDRVTGVRLLRQADATGDGGGAKTMQADLVVDATGRSSRTAAWLSALGYAPPAEEQVTVDIKYASRPLRLRPGALGGKKLVAISARPGHPRGMGILAVEDDKWILTVYGYQRHHPPTDPQGFLAFAETVAPPDVFTALRYAQPLDGIAAYRFPAWFRSSDSTAVVRDERPHPRRTEVHVR